MKRLLTTIISWLLICPPTFAAVGAKTIWALRPVATANNVNGAGFDWGATFATDLTCTSCTGTAAVVASATQNFTSTDAPTNAWYFVGSGGLHLVSNCWFPIASVAANVITLNSTAGAGVCLDTSKGHPTPKFVATTTNGISNDGTATISSGTNPWGIDYSQTDTATYAAKTDLTIDASVNTSVTSAAVGFKASHIGNVINITVGTSWTLGWREITAVAAGVATLDASPSAAANANLATFYLGGAVKLNSITTGRTDTNFFTTSVVAGNRFLVQSGTYTVAQSFAATNASVTNPIIIEGFQTLRGDAPTGANLPQFNFAATQYTGSQNLRVENLRVTGSGATVWIGGTNNLFSNFAAYNFSTTTGRNALTTGSVFTCINCDLVSLRGVALNSQNVASPAYIIGSYIHDSDIAISNSQNEPFVIRSSILAHNVTSAYKATTANTSALYFDSNTFYGAENKLGACINFAAGNQFVVLTNNIVYGCVTGITDADSQVTTMNYSDYNDLFNNTNDVSQWQVGTNSRAVDPQFTSIGQYTNVGTPTTTASVLTDSGANFANIVDDRDVCYISAVTGTGALTGMYPVHAHTSTTLTFATPFGTSMNVTTSGSGSSVTYECTYGRNFSIGANLKGLGFPGAFPGGVTTVTTTGSPDIGAVQRLETSSSGQKGYAIIP